MESTGIWGANSACLELKGGRAAGPYVCTAARGADKVWLDSCGCPTASSPGLHLVFLYMRLLSGTL